MSATYWAAPPDAEGLCKNCGERIARWTTAEWSRWFHVPPEGSLAFPRRGCRAAGQDRAHVAGRSSWDEFPRSAKAEPA